MQHVYMSIWTTEGKLLSEICLQKHGLWSAGKPFPQDFGFWPEFRVLCGPCSPLISLSVTGHFHYATKRIFTELLLQRQIPNRSNIIVRCRISLHWKDRRCTKVRGRPCVVPQVGLRFTVDFTTAPTSGVMRPQEDQMETSGLWPQSKGFPLCFIDWMKWARSVYSFFCIIAVF